MDGSMDAAVDASMDGPMDEGMTDTWLTMASPTDDPMNAATDDASMDEARTGILGRPCVASSMDEPMNATMDAFTASSMDEPMTDA